MGLSNVGATVLLVAIAATGLLLATNFSFVRLYEILANAIGTRFAFVGKIPERFTAWRQLRAERATLRKETKAAIKAEREAARSALKQTINLSPAERVADFMKEPVAARLRRRQSLRAETKRASIEPELADCGSASAAAGAGAGAAFARRRRSSPVVPENVRSFRVWRSWMQRRSRRDGQGRFGRSS